jgi:hypothetical protein
MRLENFRAWLLKNEPILRFVEVVFVIVVVGCFGAYVSWQQTRIAQKSLEVSAAELEAANLQADLARLQFTPRFEFNSISDDDLSVIKVKASGAGVRYLRAQAKLFLQVQNSKGRHHLILIENFFSDLSGPKDGGEIGMYYPGNSANSAAFGFAFPPELFTAERANELIKTMELFAAQNPDPSRRARAHTFVELKYYTHSREEVVELFQMEFPASKIRPVADEPRYDRSVDFAAFRRKVEGDPYAIAYDYVALDEAIDKVINEFEAGE